MAEISRETIKRLWYATRDYSWESLRQGLREIWNYDVISTQTYEDIKWAINKLEDLGTDFPISDTELHQRLDHYM